MMFRASQMVDRDPGFITQETDDAVFACKSGLKGSNDSLYPSALNFLWQSEGFFSRRGADHESDEVLGGMLGGVGLSKDF